MSLVYFCPETLRFKRDRALEMRSVAFIAKHAFYF